jgi:hypothetical protein
MVYSSSSVKQTPLLQRDMQFKVLIALVFATLVAATPTEVNARSDDVDSGYHPPPSPPHHAPYHGREAQANTRRYDIPDRGPPEYEAIHYYRHARDEHLHRREH